MKRIIFSLLLTFHIFTITSIYAQKINYGAIVGVNTNFLTLRSDYNIQNGIYVKPTISYNFGGYVKTNRDRINLSGSLEY